MPMPYCVRRGPRSAACRCGAELSRLDRRQPHTYTYDPPPGAERTNIVNEPVVVPIYDARVAAPDATLDREGFARAAPSNRGGRLLRRGRAAPRLLSGDRAGDRHGHGRQRVFVFDHTIRRRVPGLRIAPPARRASRCRACMWTRPRNRVRSGCATCWATRPRNC